MKSSDHDIVEQAIIESGITDELLIIDEERDLKKSCDRKHESNINIVNTSDSISHKMKKPTLDETFAGQNSISNKSIIRKSGNDQVKLEDLTGDLLVIDEKRDLKNSSDRKQESNVNIVNAFDSVSHKMKKSNFVGLTNLAKIMPGKNTMGNKSIIRQTCHDQLKQEDIASGLLVIDEGRDLKKFSDRKHESNVNTVNTFDSILQKMKKPNLGKILPGKNTMGNKSIIRYSYHDQVKQEGITGDLLVIDEEKDVKNPSDRKHESNISIVNTFDNISQKMKQSNLCNIFPGQNTMSNKPIIKHSSHNKAKQELVTDGLLVIDEEITSAFDNISHKMKKPNLDKICPKESSVSNKSIVIHLCRTEIRQKPVIDNEVTGELLTIDEEIDLKNSSDKKCESNINIVNESDSISHEMPKLSTGEIYPKQNSMSNNKSIVRHFFQNDIEQELEMESEESDGVLIIDEDREI